MDDGERPSERHRRVGLARSSWRRPATVELALEPLQGAPRRCRRLPDSHRWVEAYSLAALCGLAVDGGLEAVPSWVTELETLAARHGMRELVATAAALRGRLGEPRALDTAPVIAADHAL